MPSFFQIKTFLTYWLNAVDEHSLHSPFFYDFYTKIVRASIVEKQFASIENLRNKLLHSNAVIHVKDPGAGSQVLKNENRKVAEIAKTSLTPLKYSALYHRIAQHFKSKNIIELGTSFGINTLYLSSTQSVVTTFEGAEAVADIARSTFDFSGQKTITLVEGDINETLPDFLEQAGKIDLAFIDANHTFEATTKYFELIIKKMDLKSIVIVDDIHYSPQMEDAWNAIKANELVYGSADLFRCGIVFFDPSLNKQHVILQF